jgi:DNA-binding IclR family transcriptional regulator
MGPWKMWLPLGEFETHVVDVAAPVPNHVGCAVASVTVGAPASRANGAAMPHLIQPVVGAGRVPSGSPDFDAEGGNDGRHHG